MAYATNSSFGSAPISFDVTPWVRRLLIANAGLFLLTTAVPVVRGLLVFTPSEILVRPWGVVTYMFVHGGLWHLLGNLLIIFFFGPALEKRWGSSAFIRYYMVSGLGAILLSFLFSDASILGASGAAYGLMLAFALYWPDATVMIWGMVPVKVKILVGFMAALTLMSVISPTPDGIAHLAHLGGLVSGFVYLRSGWMGTGAGASVRSKRSVSVIPGLPDKETRERKRQEKDAAQEKAVLDAVDAVLDKISAHGIGSLTKEERALLDRVSKKQRTN